MHVSCQLLALSKALLLPSVHIGSSGDPLGFQPREVKGASEESLQCT